MGYNVLIDIRSVPIAIYRATKSTEGTGMNYHRTTFLILLCTI